MRETDGGDGEGSLRRLERESILGSEARLLSALKEIPSLPSSSGHRLGMETSGREPGQGKTKETERVRRESTDREIRVYRRATWGKGDGKRRQNGE